MTPDLHSITWRKGSRHRFGIIAAVLLLLLSCGGAGSPEVTRVAADAPSRTDDVSQQVIIECVDTCEAAVAQVQAAGGAVNRNFTHIDAIAATIPTSAFLTLQQSAAVAGIGKDSLMSIPRLYGIKNKSFDTVLDPKEVLSVQTSPARVTVAGPSDVRPASYGPDNSLIGASDLQANGITGNDIVVAIIDSGTANNPDVVESLADSIIGGESLVGGDGEPSATSTLNDAHGTWVGTMIAAHAQAVLAPDSKLAAAVTAHMSDSITAQPDGTFVLPIVGTAPAAKLYAIKVFPADGSGSPRSRTIAALERVLTLKLNFNEGVPSVPVAGDGTEDNPFVYDSLDIKVVNLSLGGPTLFPSGELEELIISQLLQAGVVVVASAGNEGFAAITGASPGTALAALTVGAASSAANERVLRDLQDGPGTGLAFRPTDFLQVAEFSSRGPTADGRVDPDVLANGVAVLTQGPDGHLNIVSGTSFSSPAAAGAAALLWEAVPEASAADIRAALIETATADLISTRSTPFDQGNGIINVSNALDLLRTGDLDASVPTARRIRDVVPVLTRLERVGVEAIPFPDTEPFTADVNLVVGQVAQFYVSIPRNVDNLTVSVTNITPELPKDQQNVIFGDDLLITIVDSPLSFNDTRALEVINNNYETIIDNPQPGLVRVALMGDWTNVGNVAATLSIVGTKGEVTPPTLAGEIEDQQLDEFTFEIPANTSELSFELSWRDDWSFFPTHDVDLLVIDPAGTLIADAATLANPERLAIADPSPGTWTVVVDGFELHGFEDDYALTIRTNAGPLQLRRTSDRD